MKLLLTSSFPMKNNQAVADWIDQNGAGGSILYAGYSENAAKYIKKWRIRDIFVIFECGNLI